MPWVNSLSPISLKLCAKVHTTRAIITLAFLTVVLESTAAAPTFRGFLIQARLVTDDSTVVGQFEEPPVGGEYRYGSCANTEVEKNSSVILTKIAIN